MDWYIAYTKLQCEAKVAESLARIGVESYLPMRSICVTRRRKRRIIERTLFPGYLFANDFSFDRRRIDGLQGFLSSERGPVKIAAIVVDEIRDRIAAGEFDVRRRDRIVAGMKVSITSGPFQGITGQVQAANATRADLLIELFSGRVSMSIAVDALKSIP